ncbi:lysosomal aspartic protease-like protein, partial [Dinothrombium tinctorium]
SPLLWVPSRVCTWSCVGKRKFSCKKSSTCIPVTKSQYSMTYGTGNVKGIFDLDTVTLANLSVKLQPFLAASSTGFVASGFDGILGASYNEGGKLFAPFSLFYNMVRQGLIERPTFSVHLKKNDSSLIGGTVTFGGSDRQYYTGDFVYAPLMQSMFWQIVVDSISLTGSESNETIVCERCSTIIDTGTSFIGFPERRYHVVRGTMGKIWRSWFGFDAVIGQRYVCYDQPCVGDINGASQQCYEFCSSIGYTFGHCANKTMTEDNDYERRIKRQKRQAPADIIATIISGAKSNSTSSSRGKNQASEEVIDWTKHGNQCQCYSCDKQLCDKYCQTRSDQNCLQLGQLVGINLDICGCEIDTSSSDNLLDIIDTLCG